MQTVAKLKVKVWPLRENYNNGMKFARKKEEILMYQMTV
jgi:hypothetical protein